MGEFKIAKSLLVGPAMPPEQFVGEHVFFYLGNGKLDGCYGNKHYTLKAGEFGILRKNRLGRFNNQQDYHKVQKILFVFDEGFLQSFQEKHPVSVQQFKSAESFLKIPDPIFIPNFIASLKPYLNNQGEMDNAFFEVKREELLLILLQLRPELSGLFFTSPAPEKIDLEAFMNENYQFNVKIERFAYMTGRSLSAFKRDFKQVFNDTPSHWLLQRRLTEAYHLIHKKNKKPSEIFMDLGFENLSHFCFAFKKLHGITPTELAARNRVD